ncbi:MAG: hypothetical protein U0234_23900 [Sandaracinus sp.]
MTRFSWALVPVALASIAGCANPTSTCVPGMAIECPCSGATSGVQICGAGGTFGACDCGGVDAGGGTDSGTVADAGSDAGNVETDTGVDAATSDANDRDAWTDPCVGHVTYAARFDNAGPVWASLPASGGMTGLDAGNAQCEAIGADHVCDYEEVLVAQAAGELAGIPIGTTAWVQRTTTAQVGGVDSAPGPGGRCNDWSYATNHISDGEYITFDTAGVPTYHLDNDTIFDPNNPGVHTSADLPCGGATRSILCCNAACTP